MTQPTLRRRLSRQLHSMMRSRIPARDRGELIHLATECGTDKWGGHLYARHYATHLAHLRDQPIHLLEIGIGGYHHPDQGGQSLRMWKRFFPRATIFGLDLHDKTALAENRIRIFTGSQDDPDVLARIVDAMGHIDVIIDDGSHRSPHVIASFEFLFPHLRDGGIYAVEDTQTSYWPEYGGSSDDRNTPRTTMGYFKALADGLNHDEIRDPLYQPPTFAQHILALHFYHNLIFLEKGANREGSNVLDDPTMRRNLQPVERVSVPAGSSG